MIASPSSRQDNEPLKAAAAIVLVIEIGGTKIRGAVCTDVDRELKEIAYRPTPNYLNSKEKNAESILRCLFDEIFRMSRKQLHEAGPDVVVVGYPGPITKEGIAVRSPTILGSMLDRPVDVRRAFRDMWPKANVTVLNDLTCAGYSCVARGYADFCIATVGSGVGNKVFLDGTPITGPNQRGGEIGHLRVTLPSGTPLAGFTDEVGRISSGRGVIRLAQSWFDTKPEDFRHSHLAQYVGSSLRSEHIVSASLAGDTLATRIVKAACFPLAQAFAGIHLAVGIERFVVTGGFAKAMGKAYESALVENIGECTWDVHQDWASMVEVGCPEVAEGLVGAAFYAARPSCGTKRDARARLERPPSRK